MTNARNWRVLLWITLSAQYMDLHRMPLWAFPNTLSSPSILARSTSLRLKQYAQNLSFPAADHLVNNNKHNSRIYYTLGRCDLKLRIIWEALLPHYGVREWKDKLSNRQKIAMTAPKHSKQYYRSLLFSLGMGIEMGDSQALPNIFSTGKGYMKKSGAEIGVEASLLYKVVGKCNWELILDILKLRNACYYYTHLHYVILAFL